MDDPIAPQTDILRGIAWMLATMVLFFSGLAHIPMADATSVMFVAPILVTALSLPVLGERVGPRRWVGVAIGFIDALIIIRPGLGVMQPAILLPLGAACFHAPCSRYRRGSLATATAP